MNIKISISNATICLIILFLNFFDLFSTHYFISMGIAKEVNPFANYVLMNYGFPGLYIFKITLTSICLIALAVCWQFSILGKITAFIILLGYLVLISYQVWIFIIPHFF